MPCSFISYSPLLMYTLVHIGKHNPCTKSTSSSPSSHKAPHRETAAKNSTFAHGVDSPNHFKLPLMQICLQVSSPSKPFLPLPAPPPFPPSRGEPSLFYMEVLICSRCLSTVMLASMKRSTQFCMHGSSYLSSLPELILLVMHFLKHVSVRAWIAVWAWLAWLCLVVM